MVEAGIPFTSPSRCRRIDALEITHHFSAANVHAVQVKAIETHFRQTPGAGIVMAAKPADKSFDIAIAPHPAREPFEISERLLRGVVTASCPNVPIHPVRVGPVRLDRNCQESMLLNQPLCDVGPDVIKIVSAVRGLTNEHVRCFTDAAKKRVEIDPGSGQWAEVR